MHLFSHTPSRRTQGQLDLYLTHGLSVECKWENQTWKTVEEGNCCAVAAVDSVLSVGDVCCRQQGVGISGR